MYANTRFTIPVVIAAGLLGFAVVGIGGLAAAEPVAQDTNDFFISHLNATGIPAPPRAEAISLAHNVCEAIAGGVGPEGAASAVADFTDLDLSQSQVFVYVSVESYCPQYVDIVD
jgi:hypothetical protein